MYYRLIDAIQVPKSFIAWKTGAHGVKSHCRGRLVPGRDYFDYVDDPVFIASLKELHDRFDYSPELEKACVDCGAKYELPKRTCSCQRQKIDIWYVEVVED